MASFFLSFFFFFFVGSSFNTAAISFTPCPHDLHTAALNVKHKPLSVSLLLCQRVMGWWPFWGRVLELWYLLFYLGPGLWKWSSLLRASSRWDSQTPTLTKGATRSSGLTRARNDSRQFTAQDAQLLSLLLLFFSFPYLPQAASFWPFFFFFLFFKAALVFNLFSHQSLGTFCFWFLGCIFVISRQFCHALCPSTSSYFRKPVDHY